jgi:hypothetical protein
MHHVKEETVQYCHQQQHNAVGLIGPLINQSYGGKPPQKLHEAITAQIVSGVCGLISQFVRNLEIKKDENLLEELKRKSNPVSFGKTSDVFISHASEDKDFARPLAEGLRKSGLSVWYDEYALTVGDGLRSKSTKDLRTLPMAS